MQGGEILLTVFGKNAIDVNKYLYHYTRWEIALEHIFPTGEMRFSPLQMTNDPRESKEWMFMFNGSRSIDKNEMNEISNKVKLLIQERSKVICFTREDPTKYKKPPFKVLFRGFAHPRMWAQYAGNHTGVCLIFDKKELTTNITAQLFNVEHIFEGPVSYKNQVGYIDAFSLDYSQIKRDGLNKFISQHISKYHKMLFFGKLSDWKSELEYRWVVTSRSPSYEYFYCLNAISGIVLGADFPEEKKKQIVKYCRNLKIPLLQLSWHNGYPVPLPIEDY